VLGVVGLVVGGIWIAATAVRQRTLINELEVTLSHGVDYFRQNPLAAAPTPAGASYELTPLGSLLNAAGLVSGIFQYNSGVDGLVGGGLAVNFAVFSNGDSHATCAGCKILAVAVGFAADDSLSALIPKPEICSAVTNLFLQSSVDIQGGSDYGLQLLNADASVAGTWDPESGDPKPSFSDFGSWCQTAVTVTAYYGR